MPRPDPFPRQSWARAKRSIINSFIFSFEQPGQIASQQMTVEYEKLPADFLTAYRTKIEAVTLEDVRRVAAAFLHEKERLTLIVGDAGPVRRMAPKLGPAFAIRSPALIRGLIMIDEVLFEKVSRRIDQSRQDMIELQKALTAVPAVGPANGGDGEMPKALALKKRLVKMGFTIFRHFDALTRRFRAVCARIS